MQFTYVQPKTRATAVARIRDYNHMTIEWGRYGPSLRQSTATGRLTLLDRVAMTTDACQTADVGHFIYPLTPDAVVGWITSLPGLHVVRRSSFHVDGRAVRVFDVTLRNRDCDPFAEFGAKDDPRSKAPIHRLYVIPSDADTIVAVTGIFNRSGIAAVTDRLVSSIHFLE